MIRTDGKPRLAKGRLAETVAPLWKEGMKAAEIAVIAKSTVASVYSCIQRLKRSGAVAQRRRSATQRPAPLDLGQNVPRGLGAARKPVLPRLTATGAFEHGDLLRYLREAQKAGMYDAEIAKHLNVPVHRIVYFSKPEGRKFLERQAMLGVA
jgi:hypothetical protein